MALKEYKPGTAFAGVIERTFDKSSPAWPEPLRAKKGAPNVLFIVIDDTGFGHLGCYGGLIETPNIDALAKDGLRYANMHTTALCSPTRSCILTGRNHHSNHMAGITEISTGYPGYDGYIPFENGFLSEILQRQGYNTYAVGKWHLTPSEATSAAGPYDRWPLGRGFERYFGFLGGDTHQYYPELVRDNTQTEPEKTPEEGYHLTPDLVEKAKAMIADAKQVAPDKPFFMYFATGAAHAPHHVPKEWADRYKGKFDEGSVTAEVEIPRGGAEGVLFSMGGNDGGFSFYVKDGKLRYAYNYVAQDHFYVGSKDRVPEGHHFLSFEFKPTGKPDPGKGKGTPATVRLLVDGKEVGRGDLPVTIPLQMGLGSGAAVGVDPGSPATPEYKPPFKFTGSITRVQVDTSGEAIEDKAAKLRALMARQ
jgi:hypothetical protein